MHPLYAGVGEAIEAMTMRVLRSWCSPTRVLVQVQTYARYGYFIRWRETVYNELV